MERLRAPVYDGWLRFGRTADGGYLSGVVAARGQRPVADAAASDGDVTMLAAEKLQKWLTTFIYGGIKATCFLRSVRISCGNVEFVRRTEFGSRANRAELIPTESQPDPNCPVLDDGAVHPIRTCSPDPASRRSAAGRRGARPRSRPSPTGDR